MERLRRVRLLCLGWTSLLLVACGGGGGGNAPPPPTGGPPPPPVSTQTLIETPSAAVRFLSWSTFGGTKAQIDALTGMDAADWLKLEFSRPPTYTLPKLASAPRDQDGQIERWTASGQYWDQMFTAPDQLRQRMAFALSQILVYSDITNLSEQAKRAYYQDILIEHAFGNYRDLLQDVTYSPAMSQWLTYYRNRKGDPNTGRMPDENYARELLQLFTLGLVELNPDGTVATGANEIFDNEDIVGLARVFTGLSGASSSGASPTRIISTTLWSCSRTNTPRWKKAFSGPPFHPIRPGPSPSTSPSIQFSNTRIWLLLFPGS